MYCYKCGNPMESGPVYPACGARQDGQEPVKSFSMSSDNSNAKKQKDARNGL